MEQLITSSDLWSLNMFHGSNLSRVFLNTVKLDTKSISRLTFPSLAVLGLEFVNFVPDPLSVASFPSLRHLIFDCDDLDSKNITTLTSFCPELDSITLPASVLFPAVPEIPSLPLARILVNLPWYELDEPDEEVCIVHLRLIHCDVVSLWSIPECVILLDSFASALMDPDRFSRLESLYLPSLASLDRTYPTITSIENAAVVAKERDVLVVREDRSDNRLDELTVNSQISEEFMRRMTEGDCQRGRSEEVG
ncbi:uncharacterized protein JCM6883_007550 [Sporobolomyces salmoneus]|uniref:uncharacterized protein n=1 Tax=Sporobolomyces salmoneus TaxID=183962 RepID=UPI00317F0A7B